MTGLARPVRVGIIGAGLMGRELAGVLGRWPTVLDSTVAPRLTVVCDVSEPAREWFRRVATVEHLTDDYRTLLDGDQVDVLYVAVPHHLHESVYSDVAEAKVDFLGEKPFGIDPAASGAIVAVIARTGVFARCSSELPFYPGAQRAIAHVRSGALGDLLEVRATFHHSSDLDVNKPINWKRQTQYCGQIGVMGDLGMHVMHVPLRLGWRPTSVFAQLQDVVRTRPDGHGGYADCDTIDNATLICRAEEAGHEFPMQVETKRIGPGEMNTWVFRAVGTRGGVEFSTRQPTVLRVLAVDGGEQVWGEVQVGSTGAFATATAPIFETGFPDTLVQMWAAFLAEREGELGERFGCATPAEALDSHLVFDAALRSAANSRAVEVPPGGGHLARHGPDSVSGVIGRA
jgi:predicted dehydrogenase